MCVVVLAPDWGTHFVTSLYLRGFPSVVRAIPSPVHGGWCYATVSFPDVAFQGALFIFQYERRETSFFSVFLHVVHFVCLLPGVVPEFSTLSLRSGASWLRVHVV